MRCTNRQSLGRGARLPPDRALAGEWSSILPPSWSRQGRDIYLDEGPRLLARWGAKAKVAQLDKSHPRIRPQASLAAKPTIETSVEQFDLATVIKMSEAVAGEIVLEKLIETLMVMPSSMPGPTVAFCSFARQPILD